MKFKQSKIFEYGYGLERLDFYIRSAGGLRLAVRVRACSRSKLAHLLLAFRRARRSVPASSRGLFGGGFVPGSLRWLACYSGFILHSERRVRFRVPCASKINRSRE